MKLTNSQKLVVVLGPTSSGKTGLARKLCQEFNGYIISADSRQIYRYMDIGTGKVESREELEDLKLQRQELLKRKVGIEEYGLVFEGVGHYMIDTVEPLCDYNVALYKRDIYQLLKNYELNNSVTPFIVGGTGLYIDAVVDNWQFPKGEPNVELRQKLEKQIEEEGLSVLWQRLIGLDPGCKAFVQKQNPRRVARALEYVLTTGKKFSKERGKGERQFDVLKIGIVIPREELYRRIDERVDARLKLGMIDEVLSLHYDRGVSWERMRGVGLEYKVIGEELKVPSLVETSAGRQNAKLKVAENELVQRLKWAVHDYARRQMTWFRRDKEIRWISCYKEAYTYVKAFLDE